jgi:hypothetical protein
LGTHHSLSLEVTELNFAKPSSVAITPLAMGVSKAGMALIKDFILSEQRGLLTFKRKSELMRCPGNNRNVIRSIHIFQI